MAWLAQAVFDPGNAPGTISRVSLSRGSALHFETPQFHQPETFWGG